jgi:Helix-hairpin-helix motif
MASSIALFGQNDLELEKQNIIEQRIEAIASSMGENSNLDFTNLLQDLNYYFEHPLDINTATDEELRSLYLINDIQIFNLQNHIQEYGKLRSLFELQAVRGFDMQTIRLIQPFVTVDSPSAFENLTFRHILKEGSNDFFVRYKRTAQEAAGFKPNPENTNSAPNFLGSPNYFYSRYTFQYKKNISAGFTMEKDAGESIKYGPDFYSGHIFLRDKRFIRTLAIGDYQAQFGQGLTFWNGLGFGKTPFVLNVKKNAIGLRPYRSVNEALYLRGVATTMAIGKFSLTSFFSRKKIDGNTIVNRDSTATDDGMVVSSLVTGGYHRTLSELADKNTVTEQVFGSHLQYSQRTLTIGLTAANTSYSAPIQPNFSPYSQFQFSGKQNSNIGLDYQYVFKNVDFFGEFSRSQNGGLACVNGMLASLHPRLSVSAVYRNFQRNYQAQYFNVFQEGSDPSNENGLFVGAQATIGKGWTFSTYIDQIKYPWLKSRIQMPSQATDYLAQFNYKPDKKNEIYIRYRYRNAQENATNTDGTITFPVSRNTQTVRFNAIYQPHENVQLRTRIEWNEFRKEGLPTTNGFLMYQDVVWEKIGKPLSVNIRYAIFDAASFNNRIYAYESDVLYAFSIPPYSGRGSRAYVMLKYNVKRGVEIWLRAAEWFYSDRNEISSGNSLITGRQKTDFTIQVRYQF